MTATATAERVSPMSDPDQGTKTVRIAGAAATKLQTIKSLKEQMGEDFKPVEFLNGLVEKPIDELFEETNQQYAAFLAEHKKAKKKS